VVLNFREILWILIALITVVFSAIIAWKRPLGKKSRTKFLWKLVITNAVFLSIGISILIYILPQTLLTVSSWIVFNFLISYVFCVELPSWLKISKFDDDLEEKLKDVRSELVMLPFDFDAYLQKLINKKEENKIYISENRNLESLLENFLDFSKKLDRFNESFWSITLAELSNVIKDVTDRSKHPFPKVIDILALSGLSILVAQFLKLLG
jgi:hypothetical protein